MQKIVVTVKDVDTRIDTFLSRVTEYSRNNIQELIKQEKVFCNDQLVKPNYRIKEDDIITFEEFEVTVIDVLPENIDIDIVYEDEYLLVVNKPVGMVVHPAVGNINGTLVNALLYHIKDLQAINGTIRPGIVHRIDKDTSGLLVVAKNNKVLTHLSDQIRNKDAKREYVALVEGVISHNKGRVNAPIGRHKTSRQNMAVVEGGKESVTNFVVLQRFEEHTLVRCMLETGRTHQIRVHFKFINHPLVGDPKYGRRKTDTTYGQYLHAKTLGFVHPVTNEYLEFESELPQYFLDKTKELEA